MIDPDDTTRFDGIEQQTPSRKQSIRLLSLEGMGTWLSVVPQEVASIQMVEVPDMEMRLVIITLRCGKELRPIECVDLEEGINVFGAIIEDLGGDNE